MRKGIQTFLEEAGDAACYALCIIKIAELIKEIEFDVIKTLEAAIQRGFVFYNENDKNDNNNFYVDYPENFLSWLTAETWTVTKESADYIALPGEFVSNRWERIKTGSVLGHFNLPNWDSVVDSQTVKYGKIVSKRVFRRVSK